MTLIVAYGDGNRSYIAGDRFSVDADRLLGGLVKQPKVFKMPYQEHNTNNQIETKDLMIGYTTSFRMGQIIQHNLFLPNKDSGEDCHEYLIARVIPVIRNLFKYEWSAYSRENEVAGGEFIIVMEHRVFSVQDDFSILEYQNSVSSVGCGDLYARASMDAYLDLGLDIEDAISRTFNIVSNRSIAVSKQFDLLKG